MTISTTEFRNNLGRYLSLSQTEDVLITHNGKVISKLTNPFADRGESTKRQPKMITRDTMSKDEFDAMLEEGYNQAMNGEGIKLDAAFVQKLKPKK